MEQQDPYKTYLVEEKLVMFRVLSGNPMPSLSALLAPSENI